MRMRKAAEPGKLSKLENDRGSAAHRVRLLFGISLILFAIFAVGRVFAPPGDRSGDVPAQAAPPRTITVFAAASLTPAFTSLQAPFEKRNSGWKVRFNFAASSALRAQIEQGAPADVFAAADYAQMRPLAEARLVRAPATFARNRLVVVAPTANPGKFRSPKDLCRPGMRIITTSEAVPIGRYTSLAIEKLAAQPGYPAGFAARVARSIVSREANVRTVLAKVELGEADAAMVYATDARSTPRVKAFTLPEPANVEADYPIAVVAASPHGPGAEAFVRFVRSPEGRAVLLRQGFR